MTLPQQPNGAPQRRKPIWPWIVLLVLTLCAIYSYNRANEIIAELSDTLPPALLNLFEDILRKAGTAMAGPASAFERDARRKGSPILRPHIMS